MFQGSYVPQLSIVLMCGIKENVLRNVFFLEVKCPVYVSLGSLC